ncbi:MAG: hypothetical protein K0R78_2944 [Pelosinus sp.]|jgi:hypothetical protein|nr:hypothetical protein [Pelosinus sp.]
MKFFVLTVIFSLLLVSQTLAISSINLEVIKEAQDYGKLKAKSPMQDFLLPWTSYEEKAIKLNNTAERSYLYTSFLLIAADAKKRSLNDHNISIMDSEGVLEDYSGLLSFSTVLFGDKEDFVKDSSVVIKQDKNVVKAYQMITPAQGEKVYRDKGQTTFTAQCYFYFLDKEILPDIPIILSITTNDKKEHNFYFDQMKIK